MRMMNRAIEDASAFRDMMTKIEGTSARMTEALADELKGISPEVRRYFTVPDRQPGENRATHRARLKRERREAKSRKVPA